MPRDGIEQGPKVSIPGPAGEMIAVALRRMATHCGECSIVIKKERLPGGGYAYTIANNQPPAQPVTR